MTIHAGWFALGGLLLLFPADRLLSGRVRLRSFESFQTLENSPRRRAWWWVPLLWLDPLRGFAGAWSLRWSLPTAGQDWAAAEKIPYAAVVAVLCAGVACQMFRRGEREALLAPLGFVGGIVAALTPWAVACIGLAMALTAMNAFRRFQAFFAAGFAVVGCLGLALKAEPRWLILALVILALPGVVGVTSGRPLEIPARGESPPA